MNLVIYLLASN